MSVLKPVIWEKLSEKEQSELLMRPAVLAGADIAKTVQDIVADVRARGDSALRDYAAKFDKARLDSIRVADDAIEEAEARLPQEIKSAMRLAVKNIESFHRAQKLSPVAVQTMPGVLCRQVTHAIDSVGLYVPGGTAPLFSTVMMLAIPAKIAGCRKVILMSPPTIADEILYAAKLCGVTEIYQSGGAQAIAAMAFGTQSVPKVLKIFGPGNAFVTQAKRLVSECADGAAIDMPAGPSEVLVIADSGAEQSFVAALTEEDDYDLLVMGRSQGQGCYCFVNGIVQTQIQKLQSNYPYIVVDNEAGMEHISRGILPNMEIAILVSDCSRRGVQAAGRIAALVKEMNFHPQKMGLIVNRAPGGKLDEGTMEEVRNQGLELLGVVPQDETVYQYDCQGRPTVQLPEDSPVRKALQEIIGGLGLA